MQRNIHKFQKTFLMASTALTRPAAAFGAAALALGGGIAHAGDPAANTLPTGGNVVGGGATINQSGNRMDINQSTDRTVIDWRNFDIGKNAHVNFNQPGSNSIAANRVNGSADPTKIHGQLTANGHVWILNPNGVMFGASARVDVSGIVASTANINVDRFMAGDMRLHLQNGGSGSVINNGSITVREAGLAAFVAPHVANNGTIHARLGKVTLASGTAFTLDLAGDRLVEIGLGAEGGLVDQAGDVVAEGGIIEISAQQAGAVVDSIINVTGYTSAASAEVAGGEIILGGGEVNVAGTLDASGATGGGSIDVNGKTINTESSAVLKADATDNGDGGSIIAFADDKGTYAGSFSAQGGANGGDGGFVETSGKKVKIQEGISVNTLAANGQAGNWTIDPDDLTVVDGASAGNWTDAESTVTNGTIEALMDTTGITLTANNSITVDAEIDTTAQVSSTTLALNDENTDNDLTINLNQAIRLGANQSLTGQGTTVNVASTGLIQNGVDVSAADATVNVAAGTYNENVVIDKAGLTLRSTVQHAAIVDAGGTGTAINIANNAGALGTITIDGFTVQNWNVGGINQGMSAGPFATLHVLNNEVIGPAGGSTQHGNGIQVSGDNSIVRGNDVHAIHLNPADWAGSGILVVNASNVLVENNTVDMADAGIAVMNWSNTTANNTVQNNTVTNAEAAITIQAYNGDITGTVITGNTLTDNEYGVQLEDYDRGHTAGVSTFSGNTFENSVVHVSNNAGTNALAAILSDNTFDKSVHATGGNTVWGDLQPAIDGEAAGSTLNMSADTFDLGSTLNVNKALTLTGAGEGLTTINAAASGYGIHVTSDNVTLSSFTLNGPTADAGSSYGIKVSPTGASSAVLNDFTITNVTVNGSARAELDLNGVNTAVIDGFTANGQNTKGAGIQIADSQNVTIRNSVTSGNEWGGLALYLTNDQYDQQLGNITVEASNDFQEANGVYLEARSALYDDVLGDLTIEGHDFIVENPDHRSGGENFTFFQETMQDAFDFAVNLASAASSAVGGWDGTDYDGNMYVGFGNLSGGGEQALSIQTAIDAADTGNTVNVLDGTYLIGTKLLIDKSLTLAGQSQAGTIIDAADTADYGIDVRADNVTLQNFTTQNAGTYGIKVSPASAPASSRVEDFAITNVTIRNSGRTELDLNGVDGATITNVTANGSNTAGVGIAIGDSADVTMTGSSTLGNDWGGVALYQNNTYYDQQTTGIVIDGTNSFAEINPIYLEDESGSNDFGTLNIAGFDYAVRNAVGRVQGDGDEFTWLQATQQAAIDFAMGSYEMINTASSSIQGWTGSALDGIFTVGTSTGGDAMSIQAAVNEAGNNNTINVLGGTYASFGTFGGNATGLTIQTVDGAVIDGTTRPGTNRIVDLRANDTTFTGFTITSDGGGVGISIPGQNVTVRNNTITNVLTGIQANTDSGTATIASNTITADYGISLRSGGNTVTGNTVNAAVEGMGVLAFANSVTGNTFNIGSGATAFALYGGAAAPQTTTADNTVNLLGSTVLDGAGELAGTDGTVDLADGTYAGTLNINHSGVSVLGESQAGTTIDGGVKINAHDPAGTVLSGIALENFTVDAANGQIGIHAASNIDGVYNTQHLSITDVTVNANNSHGIGLFDVDGAALTDVTVNGNGTSFAAIEGVGLNGLVIDGGGFGGANYGLNIFDVAGYEANGDILLSNTSFSGNESQIRIASAGVSIDGQGSTLLNVANTQYGVRIAADNVSVSGFEIAGPVPGDWRTVDWDDASVSRSFGIDVAQNRTGVSISGNNIHDIRTGINFNRDSNGSVTGNVIENTKGAILVRPAQIDNISGNTEGPLGNEWGVVLSLQDIDDTATADASRQAFLLGLSQANDGMTVLDRANGFKNRTHIFVDDDTPVATEADDFDYGNGLGNERQELPSIQAAFNSVVNGGFVQVAGGTYGGTASTNDEVHLTTTGTANIGGLTLNGAGTTLAGTYAANGAGFSFGTPIVLSGNLSLTTTGAAAITTGTINGTAAGGQTLTVNAAGPVSMGSLGGTTRLGATTIGGAGAKTLTGSTYNANSLTFSGPVTLTQALTTFNATQSGSAAGNITFNGNIFGTANGAQSVNFIAGNGAGAKSSNGDVSIQNAGTQALRLGDMVVNADDFTAATVWLAADYRGTMTGNQTFSDETLNAGGSVSSNVGGNASGPVNSGGNVNMGAGGNVSGNISGNNVTVSGTNVNSNINATNNANVTAQNNYTGSVNANSGTINAGTVDADVNGGSFTVNANSGSVTGNGSVTSGGGAITVNGQKQSGGVEGEFGQIIVEGFVLPEGATVTAGGDIVLPEGLAIGLISPAAGEGATEPKVVFVRSVQRLGALLAEGYSAIIIDLDSGFSDEEQEMAMTRSDIQDLGRN